MTQNRRELPWESTIYLSEISPHSPRISRESSLSRFLYVDFPKNSRVIRKEFFRNTEINLRRRRVVVTGK